MFEIFLFINPIGFYCYNVEKQMRKIIDELGIETCCHYVPIANVEIIQDDVVRRRCAAQKMCDFSYYTLTTNKALKDYHAIKIAYGNKKARQFLFAMQEKLNRGTASCSINLTDQIIKELALDLTKINTLSESNYVKDSISEDQRLAEQWHIKKAPTTIIFDENNAESGVLLEGKINSDTLNDIFNPQIQTNEEP